MSNKEIKVTVTKKAAKAARIFLIILTIIGIILMIIGGSLYGIGDDYEAFPLMVAGIIFLIVGIIGNLIILLISAARVELKQNPHAYDHRYNKNAMPKGAWIFIVIMLVVFVVVILAVTL